MRIQCFQHVPFEGPAALADWAKERGHTLTIVPWFDGAYSDGELDSLFVMGGPMNIYQYRIHPWLPKEKRAVEAALNAGKKVLGVCLGAQILADVLGGRVTQNPVCEIGWLPVEFSAEARSLFPFLPAELNVLHWHGDTFRLPAGASRLAFSPGCPQQAFIYQQQALALQFHLEMTPAALDLLIENCRGELKPAPYIQDETTLRSGTVIHAAAARRILYQWLDEFFS